ncbi:MAG: hypothetical protein JSW18_02535 [Candidatus Omnitrophota bacterium]|nr:MAG: hypothetical protein JSW18_02535 [Candidatus Omnitrophota bacterium]
MKTKNRKKKSKTSKAKKQIRITEGLILALMPVLGYFFAFQYEAGYAWYFGYPKELISISLPQIVTITIILYIITIILLHIIELLQIDIPKKQHGLCNSIIKLLPIGLISISLLLIYGWQTWLILPFGLLSLMGIFMFISPLFDKDNKTYGEKINAAINDEWELRKEQNTFLWRLSKLIGCKDISFLLLNVFMLALLAQAIGGVVASKQRTFFVIPSVPEMVVLRIYDDKLICTIFSRELKLANDNVAVFRIDDPRISTLRFESLGPLE